MVFKELDVYIKGKFPLLFFNSKEPERVKSYILKYLNYFNSNIKKYDIQNYVKDFGLKGYSWDLVNGLLELKYIKEDDCWANTIKEDKKTSDIINALLDIENENRTAGFFIFQNVDIVLNTKYGSSGKIPFIYHLLAKYKETLSSSLKWVIFIGDINSIPDEIKSLFTLIDFDLPSEKEIEDYIISNFKECLPNLNKNKITKIVKACKGMTLQEIDEAIRIGIIEGNFKDIDITCIYKEKANAVKKSSFLEFLETNLTLELVGGMDILKEEVRKISKIYNDIDRALDFGLKMPKGYLLIGIAGTGKTLASKAIANELNLPLYRADISSLFGGIVGETERNTREFFKLIKAVSPAVIQIDEIEKAFSGSGHSGVSDGGVTDRLVGNFLTYMQERDYPCFFVATCNDINSLPSPFVRKGRWDEIFFIDLPNRKEREEILKIHISLSKRDPNKFDLDKLSLLSADLTGAEIENAIQEALKFCFYNNKELTQKDLETFISNTKGIALLKSEEVDYIRNWAKDRAKYASSQDIVSPNKKSKKII